MATLCPASLYLPPLLSHSPSNSHQPSACQPCRSIGTHLGQPEVLLSAMFVWSPSPWIRLLTTSHGVIISTPP
ncbi:hypothetical protein BJX76DRAFT_290412 [Aspergillus varians]